MWDDMAGPLAPTPFLNVLDVVPPPAHPRGLWRHATEWRRGEAALSEDSAARLVEGRAPWALGADRCGGRHLWSAYPHRRTRNRGNLSRHRPIVGHSTEHLLGWKVGAASSSSGQERKSGLGSRPQLARIQVGIVVCAFGWWVKKPMREVPNGFPSRVTAACFLASIQRLRFGQERSPVVGSAGRAAGRSSRRCFWKRSPRDRSRPGGERRPPGNPWASLACARPRSVHSAQCGHHRGLGVRNAP